MVIISGVPIFRIFTVCSIYNACLQDGLCTCRFLYALKPFLLLAIIGYKAFSKVKLYYGDYSIPVP